MGGLEEKTFWEGNFGNLEELGVDIKLYRKAQELERNMPKLKILKVFNGNKTLADFCVDTENESGSGIRGSISSKILKEDLEKIRVPHGDRWKVVSINIILDEKEDHQMQYEKMIGRVFEGCRNVEVLSLYFVWPAGEISDLVFVGEEGERGMFENLKKFTLVNVEVREIRGMEALKDGESVETNTLTGEWSEERQRWEKRNKTGSHGKIQCLLY